MNRNPKFVRFCAFLVLCIASSFTMFWTEIYGFFLAFIFFFLAILQGEGEL